MRVASAAGLSLLALCTQHGAYAQSSTTAESSAGIGAFVASGLGYTVSEYTVPATQSVAWALVTENGIVYTATRLADGEVDVGNTTIHPYPNSTMVVNVTMPFTATASATAIPGNVSVDECFASWEKFWSASANISSISYSSSPTKTWTVTGTNIYSSRPATTGEFKTTIDYTETIINGGFTISTKTIDTTSTSLYTESAYPGETDVYTNEGTWYAVESFSARLPPTPSCHLPSSVSKCQNQWEKYISVQLAPSPTPPPHCDIDGGFLNNRTKPACATTYDNSIESYMSWTSAITEPICTQASIGNPLCSSIRDNVQRDENYNFAPAAATNQYVLYRSAGYVAYYADPAKGDFNTSYSWPTASTLGVPSCTLGCGRCAVTGGTVDLIYWPATSTGNLSAPAPTAPVTAVLHGETFTSPTMYISFGVVSAGNACGTVGPTITSTIVAIPTDMPLSSVYAGTIPCDAHMRPVQVWSATAPFNVTDLNAPVPFSIYSSQPWCASYMRDHGCNGACPTTAPYKPILVVPEVVLQGMDPSWASCMGDVKGVYDPPKALTPVESVMGPTAPTPYTSTDGATLTPYTSATPASQPTQPAAPTTTISAGEDNLPSSSSSVIEPLQPSSSAQPITDQPSSTKPAPSPSPYSSTSVSDAQSSSNNAGGIIASLLATSSMSASASAPQASPASIQTLQSARSNSSHNAGGILASLLGSTSAEPGQASSNAATSDSGTSSSAFDLSFSAKQTTSAEASTIPSDPSTIPLDPTQSTSASATDLGTTSAASSGLLQASAGSTLLPNDQSQSISTPTRVVATLGSQTFTISQAPNDSSAVVIVNSDATTTVKGGDPAATIGGQRISISASSGVQIGTGSEATVVPMPTASEDPGLGATSTGVADPSAYFVTTQSGDPSLVLVSHAGSTASLIAGSDATTFGSQLISAPSFGGAVIGTGSSAITVSPESQVDSRSYITIDSQTYSASSGSNGLILVNPTATASLAPGSIATINSEVISAPSSGGLIVGTGSAASTIDLSTVHAAQDTSSIKIGGQVFSAISASAGLVLANPSTTATVAHGSVTTINDQEISVAKNGGLVVGTGTAASTISVGAVSSTLAGPILTLGSQTFSAASGSSGIVIADPTTTATIALGSVTTVNGEQISAASSGNLVIGTGTTASTVTVDAESTTPVGSLIPLGTLTYTVNAQGSSDAFAHSETSFTLSAGGAATTIQADVVSAGSSGTIFVGSSTYAVPWTPAASSGSAASRSISASIGPVNGGSAPGLSTPSVTVSSGVGHVVIGVSTSCLGVLICFLAIFL